MVCFRIEQLMKVFNVTSRYKGYNYLIEAVRYYYIHYGDYIKITRNVYPLVANKFNTKVHNIERDIRTVIEKCWINNRSKVILIAGDKYYARPSNADFIDSLAYYLLGNNDPFVKYA